MMITLSHSERRKLKQERKRLRERFECTAIIIVKDKEKDQTGSFHY